MAGSRKGIKYLIAFALLGLSWISSAAADPRSTRHKQAKAPEPVAQPAPPPPAPLTLEQQPSTPPQVTFKNGQLTIYAQNSTLGDILRAVHAQTGADVDVPANATERVVGQIGPGPARDVLLSLLKGSHFNYVMVGAANNPDKLERVILTAKSGADGGSSAPVQAGMQPVQPVYPRPANVPPPQVVQADDSQDSTDDMTDETADQDETDQNGDQAQGEDAQTQQPVAAPNIKTPEQLLQELQRQQQLQQQGGQPGQLVQPGPPGQQPGQGFPPATPNNPPN